MYDHGLGGVGIVRDTLVFLFKVNFTLDLTKSITVDKKQHPSITVIRAITVYFNVLLEELAPKFPDGVFEGARQRDTLFYCKDS